MIHTLWIAWYYPYIRSYHSTVRKNTVAKDKHLQDLLEVNKKAYYEMISRILIGVVIPYVAHSFREYMTKNPLKGKPLSPKWGKFKK